MAQLAQRGRLDLPDALTRHPESPAHLFERALVLIDEAEAQLHDAALARCQRVEDVVHMSVQHGLRRGVCRGCGALVLDEIPEAGIVLLADGRFQRDRILRDLPDLANALRGDAELVGDLLVRRLAPQFLEEAPGHADLLVDGVDHVHGHADGPCLVGDSPGDRLADPPCCVRRELVAAAVIELLDGADEAEVAILDEVEEGQVTAHVLLGDRDDQAKVGLGEGVPGGLVAALDELGVMTSCSARSSGTRPISRRYMRTGSSREAESTSSVRPTASASSTSSTGSASRSPSLTAMPMSRRALKMRSRSAGSASMSGNDVNTWSGVTTPCSLPRTMRLSAAASRTSSEGATVMSAPPLCRRAGARTMSTSVWRTARWPETPGTTVPRRPAAQTSSPVAARRVPAVRRRCGDSVASRRSRAARSEE